MKKVYLLAIVILLFNCHNAQNTGEMEIQQIPLEKQITYIIALSMRVPYELYINDIKADCDYVGNKETDEILNYEDKLLPITAPTIDVPYFEQEWEVEITELPYELEGWSKGQDLRKWDKDKLEKKVVAFHQKIRKILNDGNSEEWMKLIQKRFDEVCIFDYLSEKQIEKDLEEIKEDVEEYSKGTMIPLEDYELKLYAEGKLVTLERKTHTREFNNYSPLDIKGWSPLISKGTIYGAAPYPILLYLPQGSDEFVIIRR